MKRTIVLLSAVLLVSAVATAGLTNPDGFEGYALTTQWAPTQVGEGWTVNEEGGPIDPGHHVAIIDGTLAANTTQVMEINSSVDGGNVTGFWYASIPDAATPVTSYGADHAPTQFLFGSEYRSAIARRSLAGETLTLIEIGYGNWWGGGAGLPSVTLLAADYDDEGARTWATEAVPGIDGFEPGNGVWWRIELQDDNVASKTRARMYDASTSPGAEDGWTSWLTHDPDYNGLDFAGGGQVMVFTNGVGEWDNLNMTPEPATMLLLGAGSLMLIRRKR